MKKKIIISIITILVLAFCLTANSCKKVSISDENNYQEFVDEFYAYLTDQKEDDNYVAIDLRSISAYGNGHFKGFIAYPFYKVRNSDESFDIYEKRMLDEFIEHAQKNYGKKTTIFLIDAEGEIVETLAAHLKGVGYKKIYIYKSGYESLLLRAADTLSIKTGTDDCGC